MVDATVYEQLFAASAVIFCTVLFVLMLRKPTRRVPKQSQLHSAQSTGQIDCTCTKSPPSKDAVCTKRALDSDMQSEQKEPSDAEVTAFVKEYRAIIDEYSQDFVKPQKNMQTESVSSKQPSSRDTEVPEVEQNTDDSNEKLPDRFTEGAVFNPSKIISHGKKTATRNKMQLPVVEQLGTISLEQLNKYHCNTDRQCVCVMGTVFDVTAAQYKYGKDGSYKSFAGHDITLVLGSGKLDDKWLDRFVKLSPKQKCSVEGWMGLYEKQYPVCGRLDKWEEDISQWPRVTSAEKEELEAECVIM